MLDEGIEICEQNYQAQSWGKSIRMVVVRQNLKERPQAPGKMLSLFLEDEIHKNYRYSVYFTNLEFAPAAILQSGECIVAEAMQRIESRN